MPSPLAYPELLQPLSPGNIVSAGIRLYRARFKDYSGVAVTTVVWIGALLILAVPITFLFYAVLPPVGATLLAIPLIFVLSFYCFGRYLAGGAAISRLVFKELMLEPETAKAANAYANSRTWGFWLLSLVLFIIFFGVIMAMYIALTIAVALLIGGVGGLSAFENNSFEWLEGLVRNPAIAVAFLLGCMAVIVTFTIVWTWISARFAVAELPYGIEPDVGATASIGRSWMLTETNVWHTVMVVFVMGLVMIPINVMIQIVSSTVQVFFSVLTVSENPIMLALFYLASLILALLGTVVTLPLSQAIKGVLYLDLRNRREGLKLNLRGGEPIGDEPFDRAPQDKTLQDTVPQVPVQPPVDLFRKVKVLTPESVELEFTLAGIGSRGLALLIDSLLVLLGIAFFWFFGSLIATQVIRSTDPGGYGIAAAWLLGIAFLGTFLISSGYFVVFETLRQGQTPGKRYAQIRVIRDDGRPVGLTQSVLRALLRPLDDFLLWVVGTALILFDQNEKRLGDLVAGTLVIQEERSAIKRKIDLSESAQGLARQLSTISDMTQLLPDDFAVVREFLQRREFMTPKARTDLSMNLARQTRSLVKLETIPAGVTSDQFLEAVYLAYQSD
jgi:uncharacterized RDD family membrane protein YckC